MTIKDCLINTVLMSRAKYNEYKNKIFDISEVKVFNENEVEDYTYRFYFLRLLNYTSFDRAVEYFDVKEGKVHLVKNDIRGEKSIIVDTENISLSEIINELNYRTKHSTKIDKKIITSMKLNNNCVKNILLNYKEDIIKNDHTIENILLTNNIKYNDESIIDIEYFELGKRYKKSFIVNDVKKTHINELFI